MYREIKSLLKKNLILHFIITFCRDKGFRSNFLYYLKNKPFRKSKKIIRRELKLVRDYWGLPPYHYYLYRLFERELTDDQLLDYIPPFYYYNIYWDKRHTGLDKSSYMSKFFQHQLFTKLGIPSIESVAMIRKGILLDTYNNSIVFNELIEKYLINEDDALFFKPDYGTGGHGIVVLSRKENIIFLNDKPCSVEQISSALSTGEDYMVQERFIQTRKMAELNKHSVNTLRICTQRRNDVIVIPLCVLRMGIDNSYVDNFCSGGLISIIDVKDGALSDYALKKELDKKHYEHPNSHYTFKDKRIDNWQEIKSEVLKYAYLLSEWKDIGWDVAIGENGIKILEINVQQGLDHQLVYNGFRRILDVYPGSNI